MDFIVDLGSILEMSYYVHTNVPKSKTFLPQAFLVRILNLYSHWLFWFFIFITFFLCVCVWLEFRAKAGALPLVPLSKPFFFFYWVLAWAGFEQRSSWSLLPGYNVFCLKLLKTFFPSFCSAGICWISHKLGKHFTIEPLFSPKLLKMFKAIVTNFLPLYARPTG
jgi:hypothetical protein